MTMGTNLKFELSDTQMVAYRKWCDEVLKDIPLDSLGSREVFMFMPCSAGIALKVVFNEHELDLTEYDKLNVKK